MIKTIPNVLVTFILATIIVMAAVAADLRHVLPAMLTLAAIIVAMEQLNHSTGD